MTSCHLSIKNCDKSWSFLIKKYQKYYGYKNKKTVQENYETLPAPQTYSRHHDNKKGIDIKTIFLTQNMMATHMC